MRLKALAVVAFRGRAVAIKDDVVEGKIIDSRNMPLAGLSGAGREHVAARSRFQGHSLQSSAPRNPREGRACPHVLLLIKNQLTRSKS